MIPEPCGEPQRPNFGRIAIIDDNPDDVFFLQRQLRRIGVSCPIATFSDGHDAMAFLRHCAETDGQSPMPELVFLDINMPGATGFSVLCWVRDQEAAPLRHLKIIILSGSGDPGDIALATALTADAYVPKHPSPDSLGRLIGRFAPTLLPLGGPLHVAEPQPAEDASSEQPAEGEDLLRQRRR